MSPDELARIATRVEASRPTIHEVRRLDGLRSEVIVHFGDANDFLGRARDLELLVTNSIEVARALLRPDTEARAMERAVKIITRIVQGQKPYNEAEIEVEVLRIFGRAE